MEDFVWECWVCPAAPCWCGQAGCCCPLCDAQWDGSVWSACWLPLYCDCPPPPPSPLNSISEKLGLDHCLCSADESPLSTLHDFNSKIKLWPWSLGSMAIHSNHCTSISWSLREQKHINGMITPFPPTALHLQRTIQFWIKGGNAAQQLFPWRWPDTTWKAEHTVWKGRTNSQVNRLKWALFLKGTKNANHMDL